MKTLLLAAGLLLALPTFAQQPQAPTAATLDARNGFRELKFGTPLSELPQMQKRGKHYVDHMQILQIGNVELNRLEFYFDKEQKLCSVLFSATSTAQPSPLFTKLVAEYGPPQQASDSRWVWAGQHVIMTLTQYTLTANVGYVGIPVKADVVTVDTAEEYARRQAIPDKRPKLNGTGL